MKHNENRTSKLFCICILLSLILLFSGCEFLQDADNIDDESPLGQWKITEITGHISDVREEGIPLLCDAYSNTYNPVIDDNLSYIWFAERENDPDLDPIPDSLLRAFSPSDTGGVFLFYISFDNGYYSNSVLGDFGVQMLYESLFANSYSFYGGRWTEDEMIGFSESGTAGGGYNCFTLEGFFVSDTRIEGTWDWVEYTAWPDAGAPECNSHASGSGSWVAVKK